MDYLALPLALKKGYLNKTDMRQSLADSIGLILSTRKGAMPFDPEFGCDLWEKEFSDLYTANRSEVQGDIRNALDRYEKRLFNVSVSLIGVETSPVHPLGVAAKVIGNYKDEGEEKRFEEVFRIG